MVVAVVRGEQDAFFAYGESGTPDAPPLGAQSRFETGSIGKTLTGTLLAEMVVRGEVALDDPAGRFLPRDVGAPRVAALTLRELATHSSGLPGDIKRPTYESDITPLFPKTVEGLYEALSHARIGRRRYSNLGFVLLAHALALAAGGDFWTLLRDRVLGPLGMTSTGSRHQLGPGAYVQGFDSKGRPIEPYTRLPGSGTGLWTTAEDMVRWLRANLDPGSTALTDALRLAQQPYASFVRLRRFSVGLDWRIAAGMLSHSGSSNGCSTHCAFIPTKRTGLVMLTNSGVGNLSRTRAPLVFGRFLRRVASADRTLRALSTP